MPLSLLSVAYPFAPVHPSTAGGAEHVLAMLDRGLVETGHRSCVIAAEGSCIAGELIPVPLPRAAPDPTARRAVHHSYLCAIVQAIRHWKPDLVHMHGIDFLDYLPPPGIPVLVTLHLPPSWYPPEAFAIARPSTWMHCVSQTQHEACPPAPNLLPFIENGVCEDLSAPDIRKRDFALALGRICPEKGFHLAFDAAEKANICLILAGEVYPYEEHQRYWREQIQPRCCKRRRFIGPAGLRKKRRLLSSARCLLVPSLVPETSSLAAMEAMMCGTPVIAFPAGALPEIVQDGVTGFLVHDEYEMSDAIRACRRIDPAECRRAARTRFSSRRTIAQYIEQYERLLDR